MHTAPGGWIQDNGSGGAAFVVGKEDFTIACGWVIDLDISLARVCPIQLLGRPVPSNAVCNVR